MRRERGRKRRNETWAANASLYMNFFFHMASEGQWEPHASAGATVAGGGLLPGRALAVGRCDAQRATCGEGAKKRRLRSRARCGVLAVTRDKRPRPAYEAGTCVARA